MPKKGQRTAPAVIGPANDPASLYHQMQHFLAWMREKNYSDNTTNNRDL
jgi:integrase/recombinase XerD